MNKISKEQVKEIIELRNKGKKLKEIANIFSVTINTIRYYIDMDFRNKLIEYNRERYRKMNKEEKKKYFENKREYQREYHNRKYRESKEFREKQKKRAKEYQLKKRKK